ncbi:SpoIIE family protein phosphatase [Kitasatospora sp. NPDC058965]|uniref:ATP-binding SpoIIE family protein phosphatase n=1 Tax=Kitasatospora sp. NPDC058965 TaxID=3346682 RepID=UPI0036D13CE1
MEPTHDSTAEDPRPPDRLGAAILEALFTQAPIGIYVLDEQLRVVRYNTAARGLRGLPPDQVLGRRLGDIATGFRSTELRDLAHEVLRTGNPVRGFPLRGRPPAEPDREMAIAVSMFRLAGLADGRTGLVVAIQNETEQERARDRLDLLHDAYRLVGTTLDPVTTAEQLAEVLVPALADAATVHVLDDLLRGEHRRVVPAAPDLPLRRVAFRTARGAWSSQHEEVLEKLPFASPFTRVLEDGRPRLVARLDGEDLWAGADPERAAVLAAAGVRSVLTVPLVAPEDAVLGVLTLYRCDGAEPYTADDAELAAQIASRGSLGIDNAATYLRERATATTLQRHLLPSGTPQLSTVETAHLYLPATAGGDWFDVIELPGARVALVVGDVFGEGVEAAADMGQLRTAVRTLADLELPPEELLNRLDGTARRLARRSGRSAAASCVYAVYDPVTRQLSAAAAGHPAPLLATEGGELSRLALPVGPPLGVGAEERENPREAATVAVADGTVLCFYTKGLLAADEHAPATLRRVLAHTDRSLPELADAVAYALADEQAEQDAVLLLARTRGLPEDRTASWTLPEDPTVVATARRLVTTQLTAWGLAGHAFEIELVASELITNAIRYGRAPIVLRLIRDRYLTCEVADSSSTAPHLRHARSTDEGGRGLYLVMRLTDRWGTRYGPRGKTIWAESLVDGDG